MNEKTGKIPRWLAAVGLLSALLVALLFAWSVAADEAAPGVDTAFVQYKVSLADLESSRLEIELPDGFEYVGLAPGSQAMAGPEVSRDGGSVVWYGPFPTEGELRFWLAPLRPAPAPAGLSVAGSGIQATRVELRAASPSPQEPVSSTNGVAEAILITKTVDPESLGLGDNMWVTYEVLFTNTATETTVLDKVTDTLPADFLYGTPADGDEAGYPVDGEGPDIVWEALTVPASGTLTMRYHVKSVERGGEYTNSVVALVGDELVGPASATLTIEGLQTFLPIVLNGYQPPSPVWELSKSASPTEVEPGDTVDYTVRIENAGTATGQIGTLIDTLPDDFVFAGMLSGSDVTTPPDGTTGPVSWAGPWSLVPGGELALKYQVTSGGGGEKVNTFGIYSLGGTELGTGSSTVTVGGGLPFEDDFTTGVSADWQPFLNWTGLSEDRWFWASVYGYYGYDTFRVLPEIIGYDLSMYNADGAQAWTDYRIEARLKDSKEEGSIKRGLTGIWFRGTYEDSGAMDGKKLGGYYVYMKPPDEKLYLMRVKPEEEVFNAQEVLASYYYAPRIGRKHWYDLIIEVEGNRIEVWFGDEVDGMVKAFNYVDTDNAWPHGTVGFSVYYTTAYLDYIRVLPLD